MKRCLLALGDGLTSKYYGRIGEKTNQFKSKNDRELLLYDEF